MSRPPVSLPSSPLAVHAPPRTLATIQAPYAPPALRRWVALQDPEPARREIELERFTRRLSVAKDGAHHPDGFKFLHPHFCLNSTDRGLAFVEGVQDIRDAVTGMDRVADVLSLTIAVQPEWNRDEKLHWNKIEMEIIPSRQFAQLPGFKGVLDRISNLVRQELALAHILQFRDKLNQVSPGAGYGVDVATQDIIARRIDLEPPSALYPALPSTHPTSAAFPTPSHPLLPASRYPETSRSGPSIQMSQPPSPSPLPSTSRTRAKAPETPRRSRSAVTAAALPQQVHASTQPLYPTIPLLSTPGGSTAPVTPSAIRARVDGLQLSTAKTVIPSTSTTPAHVPLAPASAPSTPARPRSQVIYEISDDEDEPLILSNAPRASWMRTPDGSPSRSTVSIPPDYYNIVPVAHNFPPDVAAFLDALDLGSRTLGVIASVRDYEVDAWQEKFLQAGLSADVAAILKDLFIVSLTPAQRAILDIPIPHNKVPRSPSVTSVGSESSIAFSTM